MSLFTYTWDKVKWNFNSLSGEIKAMLCIKQKIIMIIYVGGKYELIKCAHDIMAMEEILDIEHWEVHHRYNNPDAENTAAYQMKTVAEHTHIQKIQSDAKQLSFCT